MSVSNRGLVSIVTPVYNGERYLAECIESVLRQTYKDWRYVIVDNCSTDGSLVLAQSYARRDPRITVVAATEHLPVQGSLSRTIGMVDPQAIYCKPLMADDWLYPECVEKMLEVALHEPTAGLICTYATNGIEVMFDSLAASGGAVTFLSGRDACRASLLGRNVYFFGSPTTMLIRADLIRKRQPFYNHATFNVDEESCYDILQESNFCFLHQVLALCRLHPRSQTSLHRHLGMILVGRVQCLVRYGPVYLSGAELERRGQERFREYYGFLAASALRWAPREFWRFHCDKLRFLGVPLTTLRLTKAILRRLAGRLRSAWAALRGANEL
ncbi:MAG TPA: glycosyltransferase family 2 protein [Steroidobacteraceae bacterium]|jgi:glycosyltransferase involved in cell wall biosynthesis